MSRFNPLLLKLLSVGALVLLLWIPLARVESLIAERSSARGAALERVASSSGHEQRIGAAMLILPVTRTWSVDGKPFVESRTVHRLANDVVITGSVRTETRQSGIYRIPTFLASMSISGSLPSAAPPEELAPQPGVEAREGQPRLFVAISDPAAIRSLDGISVDGVKLPVSPAIENGLSGVSADLPMSGRGDTQPKRFSIELTVSGTERIQWLPLAQSTSVKLSSTWPDPAFSGAFAPQNPDVTQRGFAADWHVLQINRNFPQRWINAAVSAAQISNEAFGVDFYQPVDTYQENYRSIHYALLFIAVTFMGLFLWEHTVGTRLHPMQYAMTGAALSIFYLLLLAFSEHLSFGWSYLIAGSAMTVLLAVYFAGALDAARAGALAGVMIATCYYLLYWLVLSVDYALLCGTLALFLLLAGIMVGTRKVNWYDVVARAQ